LCCNKWLCWVLLIVAAIVLLVVFLVMLVIALVAVVICWVLCVFFFVFSLGGNRGRANLNCFAGASAPPPGPSPPPPPTVTITQPSDGASFPEGDTVPITFAATAVAADGSPLAAAAVRWEESILSIPPTSRAIGEGSQLAVVLPQRPVDVATNRPSEYFVRVIATAGNGSTAADSVNFTVGRVRID
jgi:hypothetical protein